MEFENSFLGVKEVADYLGLTPLTVYRLTRSSTIAGITNYSITNNSNDQRSDQSYSPNGNVILADGHAYEFDPENLLVAKDPATGAAVNLVYDADGNLVQKIAAGDTYTYLIDTLNPTGYAQILEIKKNANLSHQFYFGPNGIVSQTDVFSSQTRYFGKDGSNNTRYLTDASGAITDTIDYSADGIQISRTGSFAVTHLFQGEYLDPDMGLYWLRARWMNPQSGTFMGMDSFEGVQSDPASLHKYAFVEWEGGIRNSDPFGKFLIESIGLGISVKAIINNIAVSLMTRVVEMAGEFKYSLSGAKTEGGAIERILFFEVGAVYNNPERLLGFKAMGSMLLNRKNNGGLGGTYVEVADSGYFEVYKNRNYPIPRNTSDSIKLGEFEKTISENRSNGGLAPMLMRRVFNEIVQTRNEILGGMISNSPAPEAWDNWASSSENSTENPQNERQVRLGVWAGNVFYSKEKIR